jgi:Spy/CpxP family protein refolding chaperone
MLSQDAGAGLVRNGAERGVKVVVRFTQRLSSLALVLGALAIAAPAANAQATGSDSGSMRGRGPGGPGRGGMPGRQTMDDFRRWYEKSLRDRVTMNDEQIVKWRAWNAKFDPERRAIWQEDGEVRRALRQQLGRGVTPDEAKVNDAMDRWTRLERNRVALKEREMKELGTFLKPIQVARFFVFQDQVQRDFQEMDRRRDNDGRGGPPMRGDSDKYKQKGDSTDKGRKPPTEKVDSLTR